MNILLRLYYLLTVEGITTMIITSIILVIDLIRRLFRIVTIPITTIMNIFSWYQRYQPTEFPGIYHPSDHYSSLIDIDLMNSMGYSWIQSAMAIINATIVLIPIIGQPKRLSDRTYNFNVFHKFFKFYADYNQHSKKLTYQCNYNLPADYCYFGINDGVKNLLAFIKINPLIASALTSLKDPNNTTGQTVALVIDPYANDSVFGLATQLLNDDVPRVVAKFTRDLVLQSLVVYRGRRRSTMRPVVQDDTSLTAGDKAYLLLNTLVHYAQHIHACIHVRQHIHAY